MPSEQRLQDVATGEYGLVVHKTELLVVGREELESARDL